MKKLILLGMINFCFNAVFTQKITQNIKGVVVDKVSEKPLQGVSIAVQNKKAITNANGKYILENINTGRVSIVFSFTGYKPVAIPEVLVTAGKEVIIDVALEQDITALVDVTVTSSRAKKGNASNEFAGASSRSFSPEEITRFAGGRNDPSKLVSNFAGVVANNDGRNDIIVRGNSPSGVLWRIEGLPSPNPNHFATSGTTGGPISALNTNALKTSDFYTGAFAAEYGNANAAVFDINLRTGNADKHEKTLQLNVFSGLEAMFEGPLSKKKNGSSYLIGYRYSFVELGKTFGINVGTQALPRYQDWVYNIQLAKGKYGKLNLYGMGGVSKIDFLGKDSDSTDFYARQDQDGYSSNNFLLFGVKHVIDVSKKSFLRTAVSYSSVKSNFDQFQYPIPLTYQSRWKTFDYKTQQKTFRFSTYLNTKFNAKLSMRNGVLIENFNNTSKVLNRDGKPDTAAFETQQNFQGISSLIQAYSQIRYKPTNDFTLVAGLHQMYYTLSSKNVVEPRAGITYQLSKNATFLLNYGLHSQQQPIPVYFMEKTLGNGTIDNSNLSLDFTRAHHFVIGYENRFLNNWRAKAEVYYQNIFNVPIEDTLSGFSMLNAGADFAFPNQTSLQNKGTGKNYGIELTIEKFLSKGFYLLASASVFDSKYKGSDGVERNTSFNYGFAANFLAGGEWKISRDKRNAFTIDIKLTTIGGRYITPLDVAKSIANRREEYDNTQYNSLQLANYFRLDTKFGLRVDSKKRKLSHTFYIDLQNVTNHKNIFLQRYNAQKQTIGNVYQVGFFPDLLYRLQF
jgi:hypothetical protein